MSAPAERRLTRNAAQCPACLGIVESKHRHDYASCSCGGIAVDGGLAYVRRAYTNRLPIDLCEYAPAGEIPAEHQALSCGSLAR